MKSKMHTHSWWQQLRGLICCQQRCKMRFSQEFRELDPLFTLHKQQRSFEMLETVLFFHAKGKHPMDAYQVKSFHILASM